MNRVIGPNADEFVLKRTVRSVFRNTAKNYFDMIRMPRTKIEDIEKRIIINGWDYFEDARKDGRGVIVVTAHLGSFDVASQILAARSIETIVLVEPLKPQILLDHIIALRESKGVRFMPVQLGVLKTMIRHLHNSGVILLTCDRDFGAEGIRTKFFGEETKLPDGAVRIAMKTGAAIIPAFNIRRDDGKYEIYIEPALELVHDGKNAVVENVQRLTIVMEKYIKAFPEQWVVLYPVWEDSSKTKKVVEANAISG